MASIKHKFRRVWRDSADGNKIVGSVEFHTTTVDPWVKKRANRKREKAAKQARKKNR